MYKFDVFVHARPQSTARGAEIELAGQTVRTLGIEPQQLHRPMGTSFEEASALLAALPRLFIEPDGSFVWVGDGQPRWQVEGLLQDRGGKLIVVQLKGSCPREQLDELLRATGWPEVPLVFQLARSAVLVDEPQFRKLAAAAAAV